jgi:hypothetical protein
MKAMLFSALLAVSAFAFSAQAADHAQLAQEAKAKYEQRDYNNSGIAAAQEAADKYAQAAAASEGAVKAQYLNKQSEALYFVGNATDAKATKIEKHQKGIDAANQALALLGLADVSKVTDAQLAELKKSANLADIGNGLYFRGINLGQWGTANGVMESIGKWPELKRNMEVIETLGLKDIHYYGAYRVLGRGYYKIPGLLGGSQKKAMKYLGDAVQGSLVEGKKFSKSGYNNVYYAEVLKEEGEDDAAVALLQGFVDAATKTPEVFPADLAPETRRAAAEAQELLKNW